jgi:hypothetical protein
MVAGTGDGKIEEVFRTLGQFPSPHCVMRRILRPANIRVFTVMEAGALNGRLIARIFTLLKM